MFLYVVLFLVKRKFACLTEEFGCEVPQMRGARHEAILMLLRMPRNAADEVQSCPKYVCLFII